MNHYVDICFVNKSEITFTTDEPINLPEIKSKFLTFDGLLINMDQVCYIRVQEKSDLDFVPM